MRSKWINRVLSVALLFTTLTTSVSYTFSTAYAEEAGASTQQSAQSGVSWPEAPEISAGNGILIDADTGAILYEKNAYTKCYPASTTKILTGLLTVENCGMDETVTFSRAAANSVTWEDSNLATKVGEQYTVEQALYGLLLYSAKCETATVMFSREMPDWKFLSLEHMRPIREMLLRPAAGLRFAPKTIDTVLERMISLPKLDGFEAVSLFFSILNDLATAPPDEVQQIGSRHDGSYQDDRVRRIVRFVEESYSRKLSLEEIGRSVDMSPSSVCRYFKRRTHQNLWEYINSFRINRAAQLIVETQLPISEIGPRCGFTNVSNFNHLFRAHLGTTPSDYRSRFKTSPLTPDTTN